MEHFNGLELTRDQFVDMLKERLSTTDIRQVKADVIPFVHNPHDLDIRNNNYFLQLAVIVKYE